ncbi:MAG: precorrin-6A synthase (deacetylating), partial [Bauldia sp.]
MRRLVIIGIGTGNPEHVTIQAINALNRVDAVFIPRKGADKNGLAELRREICARYLTNAATRLIEFDLPVRDAGEPSYRKGVDEWHAAVAATYARLLAEHTEEGASVALLVWGDPSLYDSTLRIVERLNEDTGTTVACEVIPGIASPQALAARHGIALNS